MHTSQVSTSHTVIFVGGSHASRLAEAARSTYPEVGYTDSRPNDIKANDRRPTDIKPNDV